MRVKPNELSGSALDWAVAKCEGWIDDCNGWLYQATLPDVEEGHYKPSSDWSQGGEIIERERICADFLLNGQWLAVSRLIEKQGYGPTPLIAAMRCYVASKLGDEVTIPEELL